MANKTYLDLYRAVSKGVELPDDIPIALKISPSAAEQATDRLREALILQKTKRLYGRGRIVIELDPEAKDEKTAVQRAKVAGFELTDEIPDGKSDPGQDEMQSTRRA